MVLALDLTLIGFSLILVALASLFLDADGTNITEGSLWANTIVTFLFVGVIPFAWAWGTRRGGFEGALHYLGMRRDQFFEGMGSGSLWALGLLGVILALGFLLTLLGLEPDTSDVSQSLFENVTWQLAIAIAIGAGVGEEVLFRGVLQRWLGVWGQAVAFGLAHAGYDTVLNVVIPFAIGIALGFLYKRRGNLWTVIIAHTLYDLFLFVLVLLFPEAV